MTRVVTFCVRQSGMCLDRMPWFLDRENDGFVLGGPGLDVKSVKTSQEEGST